MSKRSTQRKIDLLTYCFSIRFGGTLGAHLMAMPRLVAVALVFVFSWVPLYATTLEKLSLDEMIEKSTDIVRGTVTGSYSAFRGSVIYTYFSVKILERWKGLPQSTVTVLVPGGTVGGLKQSFGGVPKLDPGAEYVLFLWTGKSGATHLIGLSQGVFNLKISTGVDPMVSRGAISEVILDPRTGRPVVDQPIQMRLSEMVSHISATLAKGAER